MCPIDQNAIFRRGEVWGLDVDAAQQRLATGSADADLRLYSIARPDTTGAQQIAEGSLCERCLRCSWCDIPHQHQQSTLFELVERQIKINTIALLSCTQVSRFSRALHKFLTRDSHSENLPHEMDSVTTVTFHPAETSTSYETLKPLGAVRRSAPERAAAVAWGGAGGRLLAVQSAGRAVEVFRWGASPQGIFMWLIVPKRERVLPTCSRIGFVRGPGSTCRQQNCRFFAAQLTCQRLGHPAHRMRSETEARKHMKRRRKRRREKAAKAGDTAAEDAAAVAADDSEVITAADELEPLQVNRDVCTPEQRPKAALVLDHVVSAAGQQRVRQHEVQMLRPRNQLH
jgi:hypothetical protein